MRYKTDFPYHLDGNGYNKNTIYVIYVKAFNGYRANKGQHFHVIENKL